MSFTLPQPDNRTAILGSTGSGKTHFSVWLLSSRDFHERPCVIFDFKGDDLIASIGATPWTLNKYPEKPGLYVVRPLPGDDALISRFFYWAWLRENIIIYVDEAYMLPKNDKWIRACLQQGRSKHVEMIICSQRPVFLDKFVWTEASFFAVFNLTNSEDRKKVGEYTNGERPKIMPKRHSFWYDVSEQRGIYLAPVPDAAQLIKRFEQRLRSDNKPLKL